MAAKNKDTGKTKGTKTKRAPGAASRRRERERRRAARPHDALPRRKTAPTKLDERSRTVLVGAITSGLSREEAALIVGVSERTLYNWFAKAEQCRGLAPEDWRDKGVEELRGIAWELSLEEADVRGTGARGRVLRRDWVAAIDEAAGQYIDLHHQLEYARPLAAMRLHGELQRVAYGGSMVTGPDGERRFEPERITETREVQVIGADGAVLKREIHTTHREVGRSESAIKWLLERGRHETWGRRVQIDPDREVADPAARANEVVEALRRMRESVPGPGGDGGQGAATVH